MVNSTSESRPGEFELIQKLFAPLSSGIPGAFALTDDAAVFSPSPGNEVVLKTDAIVEGVHFRRDDPARTVGKKALRVNLSDLAAKGARPVAYLLALSLPDWPNMAWLEEFARGLAEDQDEFGIGLAGGDTDRTPGVLNIAVMMIGVVPAGTMIRRAGAKPGDAVLVTGTIGDAGGGLSVLNARKAASTDWERALVSRYRLPRPRTTFGQKLRGIANAALDVSDGLIADLGHIAEVSRVRIEIDAAHVPISDELAQLNGTSEHAIAKAATSGDDYEIAFTVPPKNMGRIKAAARETNTRLTRIGRVVSGIGISLLDKAGREIEVNRKGYTHF